MPAKDKYHDYLADALKKAGWRIIKEQVLITVGNRHLLIFDAEQEVITQWRN